MPTIAFISTLRGHKWGGSEILWSEAARHLLLLKTPVTVCVENWSDPAPPVQTLVDNGATLIRTKVRHRLKSLLGPYYKDPTYNWLDSNRPDLAVISLGFFWEGPEWMEACLQRGIPYAIVVQSAAEFAWMPDAALSTYRKLLQGARAVYFVSHGIRDLARRQLGISLENGHVAYNPFNVPFDVKIPWPKEDTVRLACVGRLEPGAKGQDILFSVLNQEKWRNRDIQLSLYGAGACVEALRTLKEYYRLDKVTFGGYVKDITEVWRSHHALIMPSRCEGLPLAQVEAMLCARPCIVTDIPGNAELVEDEVSGFVAAAPAESLVDEAMERAWNRRDSWEQMGQAAAKRVREILPEDPARRFAETLQALAQSQSGAQSATRAS